MEEQNQLEEWRDIPGWEGYYQASNLGQVRSLDRKLWCESRGVFINWRGQLLKPGVMKAGGYHIVALCRDSKGKQKSQKVHHLVWRAFNGEVPSGKVIMHINDTPTDNRLCNLKLGTQIENMQDCHTKHRHCFGTRHPDRKYAIEQVISALSKYEDKQSIASIARELDMHHSAAYAICKRNTWKQVPEYLYK